MKPKLVVLTGAGISAESGLKTFRDENGLWNGYNVAEVATPRAFKRNPEMVLDFYNMRRRDVAAAKPNDAHRLLAQLQENFDVTIITQNVDDLHERGGSKNVIHLHGEIFKACSSFDKSGEVPVTGDINMGDKAEDGSQLRPFIVWFEEEVPLIETAAMVMSNAEVFILIGSSLEVYPAAGLIHYLPENIPVYIIDKVIPPVRPSANFQPVQLPATEGMKIVYEKLMKKFK